MSWVATAVVGGSVLSGVITGNAQKGAAEEASAAQLAASEQQIEEQQRQFDEIQGLLQPFVQAGQSAIGAQEALVGLSGPEAQQQAIQQLEQSPQFEALTRQGEEAILQRASATGGLRGGNVQGALAQFRPGLLSNLIEQQFGRLGGLTGVGQASAAGVGAAGQQTAGAISNILGQQGNIEARRIQAQAEAPNALTGFTQGVGLVAGLGKLPF